jgi:hypothetical protein
MSEVGVRLISDLRLLTSMIDDSYNIYDFYYLNGFYGFNDLLFTVYRSAMHYDLNRR